MWDRLVTYVQTFQSAVLNAHDANTYPASVRTPVVINHDTRTLRVQVPAELALRSGPASLLLHSHNEQLWDLKIVLVRGKLTTTPDGWIFHPTSFASEPGAEGGLALVKMILKLRKTAKSYLKTRGLARPQIPWNRLKAIKQEIK
jgi:hypothetical protein